MTQTQPAMPQCFYCGAVPPVRLVLETRPSTSDVVTACHSSLECMRTLLVNHLHGSPTGDLDGTHA